MGHDHHHGHHHGHGHGEETSLGLPFALNVAFTLIELVGAWYTNSTAIAADAVHDLGDSLALLFAWGMQGASGRSADDDFTYGYRRLSLVGAVVNAMVLLVGGLVVLGESVPRLFDPPTPDATGMLGLALLGVAVNGAAALRVKGSSLNERVVRLHLLEDVLGWVAVLIVSVVLLFAELPILDPLLSIGITLWVAWNAAKNLRDTLTLFLQGTPGDLDVPSLVIEAEDVEGVRALRHVHVWSLDGERHVLTGQLLVTPGCTLADALEVRERVREHLEHAGVAHVTLELALEPDGPGSSCG